MDDILLLDTIEQYLKGELDAEKKAAFENLRKTTPEVDQMVVEHNMFLHQINAFGERREFKHQLYEVHNELEEKGQINGDANWSKGKVFVLWQKYRKVTSIAATIAGLTALVISI